MSDTSTFPKYMFNAIFFVIAEAHRVLVMTSILFNTMLVAIILCIMRICNHLSFTSLMFCTFMKTVFQEIFDFSFSLHFKQQFGIQLSFTRML